MGRLLRKRSTNKKKKTNERLKREFVGKNEDKKSLKIGANKINLSYEDGKISIFQKTVQFLIEVKIELKKVVWPSKKQAGGSTAVVIILVMIIGLFLGIVDSALSFFIRIILR